MENIVERSDLELDGVARESCGLSSVISLYSLDQNLDVRSVLSCGLSETRSLHSLCQGQLGLNTSNAWKSTAKPLRTKKMHSVLTRSLLSAFLFWHCLWSKRQSLSLAIFFPSLKLMRSISLLIVESMVKSRLRQDLKIGQARRRTWYLRGISSKLPCLPLICSMTEDRHPKGNRSKNSRHTTKRSMLSSKYDSFCIAEVIRLYLKRESLSNKLMQLYLHHTYPVKWVFCIREPANRLICPALEISKITFHTGMRGEHYFQHTEARDHVNWNDYP